MTQIDTSTAAILARAEHIEHCVMSTHHQDALRMRALVTERDRLAMQLEDVARKSTEQAEQILSLNAELRKHQ
ncbi:hypothetical protein [Tritonibacter mobilis]|mgnify:FL=1|uniref:hypothetical protein n=1 Tax=Tritonibacter mobilis TaxID=379347 RepID=UPI000806B0B0|nr:hypothetical protein [Tritonibacter mobilis]